MFHHLDMGQQGIVPPDLLFTLYHTVRNEHSSFLLKLVVYEHAVCSTLRMTNLQANRSRILSVADEDRCVECTRELLRACFLFVSQGRQNSESLDTYRLVL